MIVKIDIDDGIDKNDAISISSRILMFNHINNGNRLDSECGKLRATITQVSKAGNIFIHVSKVEE